MKNFCLALILTAVYSVRLGFSQDAPKPDKKTESKGESKPAAKTQSKSEGKPGEKQERKTEVKPKAKPAPKAGENPPPPKEGEQAEAQPKEDPLTKIFGEGETKIVANKVTSELDPESNELKIMRMEGDINITSDELNIECDDLVIDMDKNEMIARGKIVKFSKQDTSGVCGRFTYEIEDKKTYLEGPPKPSIRQTDSNGRVTQTTAGKITMIQNDKVNSVNWDGKAEINILPTNEENKAKPAAAPEKTEKKGETAQKIDSASTDKIRNPAIGGK